MCVTENFAFFGTLSLAPEICEFRRYRKMSFGLFTLQIIPNEPVLKKMYSHASDWSSWVPKYEGVCYVYYVT